MPTFLWFPRHQVALSVLCVHRISRIQPAEQCGRHIDQAFSTSTAREQVMNSELVRMCFAAIVGLTTSVVSRGDVAADVSPTVSVIWECTASVTCKVNGVPHTESFPVQRDDAATACSDAQEAAVTWANQHCTGQKRYSCELPIQIPGVTAKAIHSSPGTWVAKCECILKNGDVVEGKGRGCTKCDAVDQAHRRACQWANELGGACSCSCCILEKPCCCRPHTRRGR